MLRFRGFIYFLTRDPLEPRLPEDVRAGALPRLEEPPRGALTRVADPREGDREPEETRAPPEELLPEELRPEVLRILRAEELLRDEELARAEDARARCEVERALVADDPDRDG